MINNRFKKTKNNNKKNIFYITPRDNHILEWVIQGGYDTGYIW